MGINKRYITKELIQSKNNLNDFKKLLNSDILILDNWSNIFLKNIDKNFEEYQKNRQKFIDDCHFKSSILDLDIENFDSKYISNIYLNLKEYDSWVDVTACVRELGLNIPEDMKGKFKEIKTLCIEEIEKKFDNGL